MYLLDTNVCVYLISGKFERVNQRFLSIPQDEIAISVIVAAELAYGVEHSQHVKENRKRLDVFFEGIPILDWTKHAIWHYARLKSQLRKAGTPVGELDLQIAAHALALDAICVTNNTREFERIEGLKLENWV